MRTILLADDEATMRTLLRATLEGPDYRILEVDDGEAALALARRERPDLIVLDWMMPGMPGVSVLKALRADPTTERIPVIMLTARGQQADRAQALGLGAAAYLTKPFSPLELLAKVEEVSREVETLVSEATARLKAPAARNGELHAADPQMALYVRDLKQMIEAERARARQLEEANERLRLLDRLKSDFLSFISHELRTPLNHLAACELFDPTDDPRDRATMLDAMRAGYERLQAFVCTGLEYFDWMAGGREPGLGHADLGAVVHGVVRETPALRAPGFDLELALAPATCRVRGSGEALARVVHVLVDNALKFGGERAWVRISLDVDGATAILTVRDRGRGFAPELARELLRPFTIADVAHHADGTALNLALATAIVEAHGGQLRAESCGPDTGSVFTVELPLARGDVLSA